jgi:hypothetical protein
MRASALTLVRLSWFFFFALSGASVGDSIVGSTTSLGGICNSGGIWFEKVVFTPPTVDRIGEEEPAKKLGGGPITRRDICALPTYLGRPGMWRVRQSPRLYLVGPAFVYSSWTLYSVR